MTLLEELKGIFEHEYIGSFILSSILEEGYNPVWAFHLQDCNGIAFIVDDDIKVSENDGDIQFYTAKNTHSAFKHIGNNLLILQSGSKENLDEFARMCAVFADPGNERNNRKALVSDPLNYWKNWHKRDC